MTTEPIRNRFRHLLDTEMMPSIVLDLQKKILKLLNAFSETPDNGFMQF
jgi:hypothetical protein